jgi:hypothetical protein
MISRLVYQRVQAVMAVVTGMLLGAIATLLLAAVIFSRDPVQIIHARQEVTAAAEHGILEMRYTFYRRQQCNSVATMWIWRWVEGTGGQAWLRYYVPIGTTTMTLADTSPLLQDMIIASVLPRAVSPGQWFLRTKYLDNCRLVTGIFGPTVRESADIPITILPGAENTAEDIGPELK